MTDLPSTEGTRAGGALAGLLWLDAASCAAIALPLMLAAGPLASLTGLPVALLAGAGIALVPVALFMAATAMGRLAAGWAVPVIVWGNAAWIAASAAIGMGLLGLRPTATGATLVLLQAVAVLGLTLLEARAWARAGQRSRATT
jgi:hypothetical protein